MTLLRTQLREVIVQRLRKGTSYRVLDHPLVPISEADLPALTVRLEKATRVEDLTSVLGSGVCIHTYEMPVVVEGIVLAETDLQRALEDMALQIMQIVSEDLTLGGLCKALYWDSGVEVSLSREGEKPLGSVRLVGTLVYRTASHAPEKPWN